MKIRTTSIREIAGRAHSDLGCACGSDDENDGSWVTTREKLKTRTVGERSRAGLLVAPNRQLLPRAGMEWMEHRAAVAAAGHEHRVLECVNVNCRRWRRACLMRVSMHHAHQISPTRHVCIALGEWGRREGWMLAVAGIITDACSSE